MTEQTPKTVAIIGGGPAELMAAEQLAKAGVAVTVYDRMPSLGRKFLMAGRGGLNLTHSEALEKFVPRYGRAADRMRPVVEHFSPDAVRAWCEGLGQEIFVGSSGRVFPKAFKASPLLRAWLRRLDSLGVRFASLHDWRGWGEDGSLIFAGPETKKVYVKPDATILALGGASWPRLGADGSWVSILEKQEIDVVALKPSNCGFTVKWSDLFRSRFEGEPLKSIALTFDGVTVKGDAMITAQGIEGGAVYALSAALRNAIEVQKGATLVADLRPALTKDALIKKLKTPRGGQSLSTYLRKAVGLSPVFIGLVNEVGRQRSIALDNSEALAQLIKALPLRLLAPFPITRAISTAGGVAFEAVDEKFMLREKPGVFVAGEMLDWEAPTGGYLLQGCFSTGIAAAEGVLNWLSRQ